MKTLLDLDPNDCRYPSGEGSNITFCASPQHWYHFKGQARKSSYCREHHFICTTVSSDVRAVA
jgi:hypothetical protein